MPGRAQKGGERVKIGLIDVDGHNWPSLPLMKISAYHKAHGDDVEPWFPMSRYDKVYMSKVFTASPDVDSVIYADEIEKGGAGYFYPDGGPPLPDEIEHIYPDYDLYGELTKRKAFGFLTRGCPRNCGFCIVSKKEGREARRVADLSEFWRGQSEIKLLDPNILACTEREALLRQLADSRAAVDFTQGLDIRLVEGVEELVAAIKVKRIHFAWDNPEQNLRPYFQRFKEKSDLPYWKMGVYVLVNFNSTHEQDLERVYYLRELGYDPYVMIYEKETAPRETRLLQRWVNNKLIFRSCERFEYYDPKRG